MCLYPGNLSHAVNLFDIQSKYADVLWLDEAQAYLSSLHPRRGPGRPRLTRTFARRRASLQQVVSGTALSAGHPPGAAFQEFPSVSPVPA